MAHRLHHVRYLPRPDRGILLHPGRDVGAYSELEAALVADGFRHGTPLLMIPPLEPPARPIVVDTSFLEPSDVLGLTTRPALDDARQLKKVPRAYNTLEERIFLRLRSFFGRLARNEFSLSEHLCSHLESGFEQLGRVRFYQQHGPWQKEVHDGQRWCSVSPDARRTIAFMIRLDAAWPGGPRLLCAFAMGGDATLVWCHQLAGVFSPFLRQSEFLMVEMEAPATRKAGVPFTLDDAGANDWQIRVALDRPLPRRLVVESERTAPGFAAKVTP